MTPPDDPTPERDLLTVRPAPRDRALLDRFATDLRRSVEDLIGQAQDMCSRGGDRDLVMYLIARGIYEAMRENPATAGHLASELAYFITRHVPEWRQEIRPALNSDDGPPDPCAVCQLMAQAPDEQGEGDGP